LLFLSKSPGNQELKDLYEIGICMSGKEEDSPKCLSAAVKISPWGKFKKFEMKSVNAKVSWGVPPIYFLTIVF
jgi:hypothetical protein